jgi:hypothetical protein
VKSKIFLNPVIFIVFLSILSGCYKLNPPPKIDDVIGHLPFIGNEIYPENGSTVFEERLFLRWKLSDEDGDIEVIELYFGKDSDPPLKVVNDIEYFYDSYEIRDLEPNITYYWKIIVKDKYNEVESPVWSFNTTYLGRELFGGIVCHVDETGEHGLVFTKDYLKHGYNSYFAWGESNSGYNAYGDGYGAGIQNTANIINGYGGAEMIAAQLCHELFLNGYDDWYLPSASELRYINDNLHANGLYFSVYGNHWSSTEVDNNYAKAVNMGDGEFTDISKTSNCRVRAVRQF